MSELMARIEKTILTRNLLQPREKILVAVSGGLDSMVLLEVLSRLAPRHGWRLTVAHFNHHLRGRDSGADQRFVQSHAGRLNLPCVTGEGAVKRFAKEEGLSLEMAARQLRHQFLARTARRRRLATIALAHHAADQMELFFLRLFRGAGGEGLGGMRWQGRSPVDPKVRLVRPLLDVPRKDLEQFARAENVPLREDVTNTHLEFLRNRVRHKLLPRLRREFASNVDQTILRSMQVIGAEADLAREAARAWMKSHAEKGFGTLHEAVQRRVILEQLLDLRLEPAFDLVERLRSSPHERVMVESNRVIWRDSVGVLYEHTIRRKEDVSPSSELITPFSGSCGRIVFGGCQIEWALRKRKVPTSFGKLSGREFFDATRVGPTVHLRHWKPGDRFQPSGMTKSVKLQDWFVNQKVPRDLRHGLIVAANSHGQIFWVEDQRIGDLCKLTDATTSVLEWRWHRYG